ncbi:unnamed protein product [Plutella xylostella]|uniref:(diamondback moth) hypothetical protein n=1 Tax=Plutella xylostella TaxID=51655 RepID=A0A8S4GAT1_PLUXY|nr:unnamed protein product [Plutella xylostella]
MKLFVFVLSIFVVMAAVLSQPPPVGRQGNYGCPFDYCPPPVNPVYLKLAAQQPGSGIWSTVVVNEEKNQ